MNPVKIIAIVVVVYVGIVVVFESMLGFFQPQGGTTLMITTKDDAGTPHQRIVARLESNGTLYVAANHWPRAWYRQALKDPHVLVTTNGVDVPYLAVAVSDAEEARVNSENPHGFLFRFVTGFPPRHFLRLEPQAHEAAPTPVS